MKTIEEVYNALKTADSDNRLVLSRRGADSYIELRITDNVWLYADADYVSYHAGTDSVHDHYDDCEDCYEIYQCFLKIMLNTKPLPAGNRNILKFLTDL